jgi:hypothetical protein
MKTKLTLTVLAAILVMLGVNNASAAITQRGIASTNTTTTTSLSINKPTGVVQGDVLIAVISQGGNNTTAPTCTGWTLIASTNLGGTGVRYGAVLYRIAGATESATNSYTFTLGSGTSHAVGAINAFYGVNTTGGYLVGGAAGGPFDVVPGPIYTNAGSAFGANSITTKTANAAVIMFGMTGDTTTGSITWGPSWTTASPGSLTLSVLSQYPASGISSDYCYVGAAWTTKSSAGATGAGTNAATVQAHTGGILIALMSVTNTTTTIASSANPSTYGQSSVTFTANVQTNGVTAGTATGSVQFQTNGVNFGAAVTLSGGSATSIALPTTLPPGNYNVTAIYSGDGSFNTSTSSTLVQTINKATPTVTITGTTNFTYNGSAQGPSSVTTSPVSTGAVTYSYAGVSGTTYGPSATKPTGAGSYTVTATVAADANNNAASSGAMPFAIAKATPTATLAVNNSPVTYNGSAQAATVGITASSVAGSVSSVLTGGAASKIGAGTYAVTASFVPTDTTDYNSLTGLSAGNFVISKAAPAVTVTVGSYTYSGSAQGPNAVTFSPAGDTGTVTWSYVGVSGTSYGPSSTPPTGAGTYTATASVTSDANNNAASSSATSFTIAKASSTVTVTGTTSFTYTGTAQGPNTSTVTGSGGAVTYSYAGTGSTTYTASSTPPTAAGTYSVTATVAADSNYNGASSSATAFTIGKAAPAVTVTVGSYTYSGSAQGPNAVTFSPAGDTGTVTWSYVGVSGTSYGPSSTPPTGAGTYTATASVTSDGNNNAASSSATAFTIGKVNTTTGVATSGSPVLPTANVTFTATVSAGGPVPTGTIQFQSNGNNLGSPVAVNGSGQASITVLGSAVGHGYDVVTAIYVNADGNFNGSTGTLSPNQLVDTPPKKNTHFMGTIINTNLVITASALLALDSDADGDPLTITGVSSTSTNGPAGNVTFNGTTITFAPRSNYAGLDLFTYTISDGYPGGTVTNTIVVTISVLTANFYAITPVNQTVNLLGYGRPGYLYLVQESGDMQVWNTIGQTNAFPNGLVLFTDVNATNSPRYYRLAKP